MATTLQKLRDFATNVSTPTSFLKSVEAIEDAFDLNKGIEGVDWRWLRKGSDSQFFGASALSALFGSNYADYLRERAHFDDSTREYAPGVSSGLRLELQRFAVVGRRTTRAGEQAACLVLHADLAPGLHGMQRPADEHLSATALLRLRAGLMTRRQAALLANHLNRFRNNRRHREPLNWAVVQGPAPDSDARAWANSVLGRGTLLRVSVGASDNWGLGPRVLENLSTYAVEVEPARAKQVFSYGPAQAILPRRFELSAQLSGSSEGMPDWAEITATRGAPCQSSAAVARLLERAGLLAGAGRRVEAGIEALWGRIQDGVPGGDELAYMASPAEVYSRSLSRSEAIATMKALRRHGFRRVAATLIGADGSYDRYEGGHPHFSASEVAKTTELQVSVDGGTLVVRLLALIPIGD